MKHMATTSCPMCEEFCVDKYQLCDNCKTKELAKYSVKFKVFHIIDTEHQKITWQWESVDNKDCTSLHSFDTCIEAIIDLKNHKQNPDFYIQIFDQEVFPSEGR